MASPLLNSKSLYKNDQEEQENNKFKHWLALRSCTKYKKYNIGMGIIDSNREPKKVAFMFDKSIKLLVCRIYKTICTNMIEPILVTENGEQYSWWSGYREMRIEDITEDIIWIGDQIKDETKDETENEIEDEIEDESEDENEDIIRYIYTYEKPSFISYYSLYNDWSNKRVIKTAINNYFNFLVLTDDGKIYYAYHGTYYQMHIKEKITCIACGYKLYMIVTDNGKIYNWGHKGYIQSGNSRLKSTHDSTYDSTYDFEYYSTHDIQSELCEVELPGKTIVKVACGMYHTLALTDKGEVYGWGSNRHKQLNPNTEDDYLFPTMINMNIRKASDIAIVDTTSAISSTDGLVYIFGSLVLLDIMKPIICEHTNIFDISNSMMGQSPISMVRTYTDEEYSLLNDIKTAFNDRSTSDLTIEVKGQPIYVHKAVLKIRSLYFRTMLQSNYIENKQSVIKHYHYSYVTFKTFLKYLYTGTINLSSIEDLLDLLKLADEYCECNLEKDCTRIIKKGITVSNMFLINETAIRYNKKKLEEYCFDFFLKNKTDVMQAESFMQLDIDKKIMFITKANNFFTSYKI